MLLILLCVPAIGHAELVAAWGDSSYGLTRLPAGVNSVKAIAAGWRHNLALRTDGTVIAWGSDVGGTTDVPAGLSNVTAISTRNSLSLALKADGTVVGWGGSATTPPVSSLSNIVAIATGGFHWLALTSAGEIVTAGEGTGNDNPAKPENIPAGLSNIVAIAAGIEFSLALKADGTVIAWGRNVFGETNVPPGLSNIVAIAAGFNHSLALQADGTVVTWGRIGNPDVPPGLSNVVAIAAGNFHSLALKADGTVVAWWAAHNGIPDFGQTAVPAGLANVKAIAAGGTHSLALVFDGPIQIVQNPQSLTVHSPETSNVTFTVVAEGAASLSYQWFRDGVALSNGGQVAGALSAALTIADLLPTDTETYTVVVSNAFGSVASAEAALTVFSAPFIVSQSPDQTVGAGTSVWLSVTADGTPSLTYQWTLGGTNLPGKTLSRLLIPNVQPEVSGAYTVVVSNAFGTTSATIGLEVTNHAPIITRQPYLTATNLRTPLTSPVAVGSSVALNVVASGSLPLSFQWRFNGMDLPDATNTTLLLPQLTFAQSGFYSTEIKNAWGTTNSAKLLLNVPQVAVVGTPFAGDNSLPLGLSDVVAVAAGGSHVLALKSDGTVRTWLANSGFIFGPGVFAVTNIPVTATNVIAISAGRDHCLALRANGTVVAWGGLSITQTNVPAGLSNVVSIAAGMSRSYAVKADGTVTGWGSSATGTEGLSNVVAVATGSSQNLALRRDGSVAFWNGRAITAVPNLTNAIAVAASTSGNRALCADGTVVSWPTATVTTPVPVMEGNLPVSNAVAIALGSGNTSLILKQNGTLVSAGFPPGAITITSNLNAIAAGGVSPGFGLLLVGNGTPAFTLDPLSQIVSKSSTVSLHARAVGAPLQAPPRSPIPPPLQFQWQHDGANLPGATNASLTLSNILGRDAGGYRLIAANALGTATSRVAVITIPFSTNLQWTTTAAPTNWFAQNRETHDGDVAAQSGAITHGQQSTLQTTVTGPGTLSFWWKVSSEADYDFLRFYLDNLNMPYTQVTGETEWQKVSVNLAAGAHTLRWAYTKDVSVSAGRDAGWLDEVEFTPLPPTAFIQPAGQTVSVGADISFFAMTISEAKPVTYQWLRFGTNLAGATNQTLWLTGVGRKDHGSYSVSVSNPGGSFTTRNATLWVNVPQRLTSVNRGTDGSLEIFSQDADGGLLSPRDLPYLEAQVSTNLVDWTGLPNALSLTNGRLRLSDTNAVNLPRRFYRMIEH